MYLWILYGQLDYGILIKTNVNFKWPVVYTTPTHRAKSPSWIIFNPHDIILGLHKNQLPWNNNHIKIFPKFYLK